VHIRIIFFAIVHRTGMNDTNNHSNACVVIIWKSYDTIDYATWVLRVLNSTRRGSHQPSHSALGDLSFNGIVALLRKLKSKPNKTKRKHDHTGVLVLWKFIAELFDEGGKPAAGSALGGSSCPTHAQKTPP
jgi:hypothetical protein